MTKEKLQSLQKYLQNLTDRLTSSIPNKHKDHPHTYKQFLQREIISVKDKLDQAKLEGVK